MRACSDLRASPSPMPGPPPVGPASSRSRAGPLVSAEPVAEPGWIESTPRGSSHGWSEIWAARELVWFLALRDFQVRYKQALVGVAWVVIQPLITVAAFTLAFQRIASVNSYGVPYPVMAFTGLLAWTYISQTISRGSEVLVSNTALVSKVYFPRLVAPLASMLPPLVDLGVGLVLLLVFCLVFQVVPTFAIVLVPVWLAFLVLTALGPVLLLAALNVRFRDVRYVVPAGLQAFLFISPVAYSSAGLDGAARFLYALNPAAGVIELGRFTLVGGPWPGWSLVVSAATAALTAAVGLLYFQRAQRSFADYI